MKYYFEITILPNQEIDKYFILSQLFTQIHLGLVSLKYESDKINKIDKVDIGISFPDYQLNQAKNHESNKGIFSKIRLFAVDRQLLENFNPQKQFLALKDYVDWSAIKEVPSNISTFAIFHRYQPKTSFERLAIRYNKREQELLNIINSSSNQTEINDAKEKLEKRKIRRNNQSLEDYLQGYKAMQLQAVNLPYINIKSLSKKHHYKIWIKKTVPTNQNSHGQNFYGQNFYGFSTYGLAQLDGNLNYYDDKNKFNNLPAVPIF